VPCTKKIKEKRASGIDPKARFSFRFLFDPKEYDRLKVLLYARTCYDHTAGEVGVRLADQLLALGMIDRSGRDFVVNEQGDERFMKFSIM